MQTGINQAIKDGNGNAIIMTAVLAAAIANILPTPLDSVYFSRQYKLKLDLESGKITPESYWWHDIGEYYFWTALWYAGMFTVLQAAGGTYQNKARWLIALMGGGLVIGVAQKNIKKEKDLAELRKQQQVALGGKVLPPTCVPTTTT